jgi:hypothetical protein
MKSFWPAEWTFAWTLGIVALGASIWWKVTHPNPIAFQVTINTEGKVARLIMPKSGSAICQKWLENLPIVRQVDERSEQESFQHKGSSNGFLDQKNLLTNTSPDNRYVFVKDANGEMILRVINRDGNGTKKLYSRVEIEKARKESCS